MFFKVDREDKRRFEIHERGDGHFVSRRKLGVMIFEPSIGPRAAYAISQLLEQAPVLWRVLQKATPYILQDIECITLFAEATQALMSIGRNDAIRVIIDEDEEVTHALLSRFYPSRATLVAAKPNDLREAMKLEMQMRDEVLR